MLRNMLAIRDVRGHFSIKICWNAWTRTLQGWCLFQKKTQVWVVCVCVCASVCLTVSTLSLTVEPFNVQTQTLVGGCILTISQTSWKIKIAKLKNVVFMEALSWHFGGHFVRNCVWDSVGMTFEVTVHRSLHTKWPPKSHVIMLKMYCDYFFRDVIHVEIFPPDELRWRMRSEVSTETTSYQVMKCTF